MRSEQCECGYRPVGRNPDVTGGTVLACRVGEVLGQELGLPVSCRNRLGHTYTPVCCRLSAFVPPAPALTFTIQFFRIFSAAVSGDFGRSLP